MKRILAERAYYSPDIRVHIVDQIDGKRAIATEIKFEEVKDGYEWPAPKLSLSQESAQELMDSLWRCGLRPTEGAGSAGALAATERHLADMKKIAFHALNIEK